jgi:hypothetical protein
MLLWRLVQEGYDTHCLAWISIARGMNTVSAILNENVRLGNSLGIKKSAEEIGMEEWDREL